MLPSTAIRKRLTLSLSEPIEMSKEAKCGAEASCRKRGRNRMSSERAPADRGTGWHVNKQR
jgi:hypothetical protein